MTQVDMQEELFVSMMGIRDPVPLDEKKVADELRYYEMSPSADGKWLALRCLLSLYVGAGCFDEALAIAHKALGNDLLYSYQEGLYFRMGQICEHKRVFDTALGFYLKSLELRAHEPLGQYWQHNNAAFCYLIRREFDKAKKHCQIAIEIDEKDWKDFRRRWEGPLQWNAWKNMGVAMEHTGLIKEAASFYTTAVKLSRGEERAVLHLRRLLSRHPDLAVEWRETIEDLKVYYDVLI